MMSEPAQTLELDCRSCGACCMPVPDPEVKGPPVYSLMDSWAEACRLPAEVQPFVVEIPPDETIGFTTWGFALVQLGELPLACSKLEGGLGDCSCSIYESRPAVCREYEPGGWMCLESRREHGLQRDDSVGI